MITPPHESLSLSSDVVSDLEMKLGKLQQALLANDPEMPNHLRESHRLILTYPETAHLLDDEGLSLLISAAEKYKQIEIVQAKATPSSRKKKLGPEDL